MAAYDDLKAAIDKIIADYKAAQADGKLTFTEIFTLVSNAVATFVQLAEQHGGSSGEEKKDVVLAALDRFYDEVIAPIDIQRIPNFIEPIVDNALKSLVLTFADSMIESIVKIFNRTGWGKPPVTPPTGEAPSDPSVPQGPSDFEPY